MSVALLFALFLGALITGALLYLAPDPPVPVDERDSSRFLR